MLAQRLLIPVLALAAWPASASVIATYTNPTLFNNNTANLFAIDLGSLTSGPSGLSDSTSGVLFSDINGQASLLSVTNCGSTCQLLTSDSLFEQINIRIPSNIIALAFYIVFPSSGQTVTVSGAGSPTPSFTSPPSSQFFGVQTDGTVTTLTIQGQNTHQQVIIDNIQAESTGTQVSNTPEAATFLLIGSGLVFMRLLRRRARTQPARRGAVATMFTGIIRALSSVLPENTTSASAPRCVSTR
jgi:hypothetical protein